MQAVAMVMVEAGLKGYGDKVAANGQMILRGLNIAWGQSGGVANCRFDATPWQQRRLWLI